MSVGTPRTSSGMGDTLLLTAICKHIPGITVELFPEAAKFKIFFDNLCEKVLITENAFVTPDIPPGHFAQQKLRFYGIENKCYLPYIHIKKEYIIRGEQLIANHTNPIVFVPNCAKHNKNREPHGTYFQELIDNLSQKRSVLQFGLSNNFTQYRNTIPIVDSSIYDLICYYSVIKQFVGVDTGDTHLMIALGGYCDIYVPRNQYIRNSTWWNYQYYPHINYHYF